MQVLETLGLNLPSFIWHTINFLVLVALLGRFLYKPIVTMLDERAARVKESMELAERVRQEATEAEQQRAALLAEARREAETLRQQAERQIEAYRTQRRQETDVEIERLLARADAEVANRQQQMLGELRAQVVDLAMAAAEKVIRERLDGQAHRRLVEEFLASPQDGGR